MMLVSSFVALVQLGIALASPLASPTISLDTATVIGTSSGQVSKFLGIPYAQPPTGNRRFRPPEPIAPYTGSVDATKYGTACPQQRDQVPDELPASGIFDILVNIVETAAVPDSEDCLKINVIKPANIAANSQLPVLVWIFGGAFESGSPSRNDGTSIVERSLELNEPVIYVSMDYRSNGFGFLASQEVKDAGVGNLGLRDQREALRWVQKYISAFGGDPKKVTIWGESAGAISTALHMVTNNGDTEGLFRAAFMQSGSTIPVGDITNGQKYYDQIVADTGCSGSSDTLDCLRQVPYDKLKDAINNTPGVFSYQALHLTWVPRIDGSFLTDSPLRLAQQGKVANIPFVSGNCDDEGTVFSLFSLNVTTDPDARGYLKNVLLPPGVPETDLDDIMRVYPQDITQGSPYDTSILNAPTPQFKRLSSIQGDAVFQMPRRLLLQSLSGRQNAWSFLSKRFKAFPFVGSAHGTDLLNVYGGGELTNYLIHFTSNLNPNGNSVAQWPQYTPDSPNLLTLQPEISVLTPVVVTQDTYRTEAMDVFRRVLLDHPL
ncbi:hypothetical protein AAF712_010113 [Marasmius tenuissimus]|uniref:Carboxylic ester hydrolase n=1 Tax=Marasmius tenuissimus TaxID=585030 RepID=A0ABR2ZRI1_9AGAR